MPAACYHWCASNLREKMSVTAKITSMMELQQSSIQFFSPCKVLAVPSSWTTSTGSCSLIPTLERRPAVFFLPTAWNIHTSCTEIYVLLRMDEASKTTHISRTTRKQLKRCLRIMTSKRVAVHTLSCSQRSSSTSSDSTLKNTSSAVYMIAGHSPVQKAFLQYLSSCDEEDNNGESIILLLHHSSTPY